jgi:hypothetical protein
MCAKRTTCQQVDVRSLTPYLSCTAEFLLKCGNAYCWIDLMKPAARKRNSRFLSMLCRPSPWLEIFRFFASAACCLFHLSHPAQLLMLSRKRLARHVVWQSLCFERFIGTADTTSWYWILSGMQCRRRTNFSSLFLQSLPFLCFLINFVKFAAFDAKSLLNCTAVCCRLWYQELYTKIILVAMLDKFYWQVFYCYEATDRQARQCMHKSIMSAKRKVVLAASLR